MLRLTISAGNIYPDGTADSCEDVLVDVGAGEWAKIGYALASRVLDARDHPEADALDVTVTWSGA